MTTSGRYALAGPIWAQWNDWPSFGLRLAFVWHVLFVELHTKRAQEDLSLFSWPSWHVLFVEAAYKRARQNLPIFLALGLWYKEAVFFPSHFEEKDKDPETKEVYH